MKVFVITLCLIYVLSTHAQSNNESNNNKPTWVDKIPERADAPQIDVEFQPDTDLDIGADDLGMDRSALFDDEEEVAEQASDVVDAPISVPELDQKALDEAEAEKIALQKKAEEEKAAEEKRLAEERQKEIDRLAEEKRIADELAAQKLADEAAAKQAIADSASSTPQQGKYVWKRIKNVAPVYPAKAVRDNKEGWVSVRVEIDVYGDVVNVRVVDTYRKMNTFNNAALKAVRQWKFDPPVNYGIETNQTKDIKITFAL